MTLAVPKVLVVKVGAKYDTFWQAGYIDPVTGLVVVQDLTPFTSTAGVTLQARKNNLGAAWIDLACTVPSPTSGRIVHRLAGDLTEGDYFVQAWGKTAAGATQQVLPFPSDTFASLKVINA